jgi:hypothetical protein
VPVVADWGVGGFGLFEEGEVNPLKAISLWQPWASFMACGIKQNETRDWSTAYRGDLVICAAKRKPSREECGGEAEYEASQNAPYGCALCIVELWDCVPTERLIGKLGYSEESLGNYTPGRFAWRTHNLRRLVEPVPVTGRQGFFYLTEAVGKLVLAQVEGRAK